MGESPWGFDYPLSHHDRDLLRGRSRVCESSARKPSAGLLDASQPGRRGRPASGESQYPAGVLVDDLYVEGFRFTAAGMPDLHYPRTCVTARRGKETVRYREGPAGGGGGGGAPAGGGGTLEGAFAVLVQR